MKNQFIFLFVLLSFTTAFAQVEDNADYEPDYNDEPELLSDIDKSKVASEQNDQTKSLIKEKNPITRGQQQILVPPPPPVVVESSEDNTYRAQNSTTLNMFGVEYGMSYEEAEKILFSRFGVKNERSTEDIIVYGEPGKDLYVLNSKWSLFSLVFKPKEGRLRFILGTMMGVFSSKEECEFNVRNFVDTLESDFSIEMVKTNKTDDRGETITYSGGKHPENGREAVNITYFGRNDTYIALVSFFPGIPNETEIEETSKKVDNHLKFMGFELDGSINDFQKKLFTKGLQISPDNSSLPVGQRSYRGVFSGNEADIVVWYNPRTKIVYRAKAIIKRKGKNLIEQLQSNIRAKLNVKYESAEKSQELVKDDYLHEFYQYSYSLSNGMVGLFITSTDYSNLNDFYLHIDYVDRTNDLKSKIEEMDDL